VPSADLVPSGEPDLTVFVAIMLLGFVVGIGGHVARSTPVIVAGIVLVLLGTLVLPLLIYGSGTK
jgi:hypothetical protein